MIEKNKEEVKKIAMSYISERVENFNIIEFKTTILHILKQFIKVTKSEEIIKEVFKLIK